MPVNYAPTPVADTKSTSREQEFELALNRYMDSYREAQLGRRVRRVNQQVLVPST